jgi:uncharacterized protein YhbP (UPF0306 family)
MFRGSSSGATVTMNGMQDDPAQRAARIIQKTIYAAIATASSSGKPWNSPVYIVFDDQLNFYWASGKDSQHSRNIRTNSRAFLAIYDSSVPWGTGEGVFIEAEATEANDPDEIAKACNLRKTRVADAKHPPEDFMGDRPRRIYRASPHKIWINQDGQVKGFFVDERVEVDLAELRRLLSG